MLVAKLAHVALLTIGAEERMFSSCTLRAKLDMILYHRGGVGRRATSMGAFEDWQTSERLGLCSVAGLSYRPRLPSTAPYDQEVHQDAVIYLLL